MLSAVLKSNTAIKVSIQIINAFVEMRKIISKNQVILQRLDGIEKKQLEYELKFEKLFLALEKTDSIPTQGVFFDGQVFDAYALTSTIIKSAKLSIILIDNYIDEATLIQLSKKQKEVTVHLLTKNVSKSLELDVKKANDQYGHFYIKTFSQSHDRFFNNRP